MISPLDGAGDVRVGFMGGGGFREAERRGASWDRIVVHFEPGLHNRSGASPRAIISKIRSSLALLSLIRRWPTVEIVVHEAHRARWWRPDHVILRRAFARGQLLFHTDVERQTLEHDYRIRVRAQLIEHREGIHVRGPRDRAEARRYLGLDPEPPLFLCAGFLHPWKGFERAIHAFAGSDGPGELIIVGSVRDARRTHVAYATELRTLAEKTDDVTLIESFQSDERFDDRSPRRTTSSFRTRGPGLRVPSPARGSWDARHRVRRRRALRASRSGRRSCTRMKSSRTSSDGSVGTRPHIEARWRCAPRIVRGRLSSRSPTS